MTLEDNAQLIIFDEATSALDTETESELMDAIRCLDNQLTFLVIAHRMTTLVDCDVVYRVEKGGKITSLSQCDMSGLVSS